MKTILSIYLIAGALMLSAQNIEAIAKGDVLKGSGGLSFNQIYNHANGKASSRLPYSYVFTGNVNLQLLGFINAPFNFMYSNLGNQTTQPTFNQTSIHPNYKWISTHFGTIACNYSPYTVNGYVFKGTAIDLTPGKFSFSAFYGRLKKVIRPDNIVGNANVLPSYKRMGGGCKISYNNNRFGSWGLVFFSAKDQVNSLPEIILPESNAPKQNWNSGIQMQKSFLKKINVSADLAYSMVTEDTRVKDKNAALPQVLRFNNTNATTSIYKAFKSNIDYAIGNGGINFSYERIDPFYQTFAAYYFNNDLENITAGFSCRLFRQKVMLTANTGIQHDNVLKTKLSTMRRFVGNANVNFKPNTKVNFNFNYSNFLSYTNMRPFTDYQNQLNPYNQWDTLNFRQISQCFSGNSYILIHTDSLRVSSLAASLTYQNAADRQGENVRNGNAFYNANLGVVFSKVKTGESIVFSLSLGQSVLNDLHLLNISPVLNFSKPFFSKKLRPGFSLSYMNSYYDNKYSGSVFNIRGAVGYTVQKLHNFLLSFQLLNRKDSPVTSLYSHNQHSNEITVSILYSVNMEFFDTKKMIQKKKGIDVSN